MARGIPRVREWRATMADGRVFRVLAPTRLLARLNLRFDETSPVYGPIVSIGVIRNENGQRQTVKLETGKGKS